MFWLLGPVQNAAPCGAELGIPVNHFDGVNEWGDLSYWEKVGELDLSQDGKPLIFPLLINFRPSRQASSPLLGKSWIFAPLDITFTQLSETEFLMLQPNGTMTRFTRPKPTDTLLRGQGVWLAEIKGDTVTAHATCGWNLQFIRGKIARIRTPQSRTFEFVYDNGKPVGMMENGKMLLSVKRDSSGQATGIAYSAGEIQLRRTEKPEVHEINSQRLIGNLESSLGSITTVDGRKFTYDYPVTKEVLPAFEAGERKMTWNVKTGQIERDGEWTYTITPPGGRGLNAGIRRISSSGAMEYWYKDLQKATETTTGPDSKTTISSWFTSGPLAGKPRERKVERNGTVELRESFSYDHTGTLLRLLRNNTVTHYKNGVVTLVTRDNQILYQVTRDQDGKLLSITRTE